MDEILLSEGTKRLKISLAGLDREARTATAESLRVTLFSYDEGPPTESQFTFELDLASAEILYSYLGSISLIREEGRQTSGRFVEFGDTVPSEVIEAFLGHPNLRGNPEVVRAVLHLNPDLCRAIIETEIDALDVQGLAYRRGQLKVMDAFLADPEAMEDYRKTNGVKKEGQEPVWQHFFERNQWIFGLALDYVIGEGVYPEKLEKAVQGSSVTGAGKTTDALLRTRGALQSLCYVEIKTARTPLLHSREYRTEVWRPSDELVGAVAQSQKTVQKAIENIQQKLVVSGKGEKGREIFFNYSPRAVVVCGSLSEFDRGGNPDDVRFSSFELFRRQLQSPEVITFDELYFRALAVLEAGMASHGKPLLSGPTGVGLESSAS